MQGEVDMVLRSKAQEFQEILEDENEGTISFEFTLISI
jgi:hypothetical protein